MIIRCYGDSNTYGFDPRSYLGERYSPENRWVDILAQLSGWCVHNDGENGREVTVQTDLQLHEYDMLIIMLGTNNILQGESAEVTTQKMHDFIMSLQHAPEKILLIAPPLLKYGAWVFNQNLIKESILLSSCYRVLAKELKIEFLDAEEWNIDIAYDGVHFSEEGNRTFARNLYTYLMREI